MDLLYGRRPRAQFARLHLPCTTFSLWDTFRGENPLLYVIQPRHMEDAVQTMLGALQAHDAALPPVWVNAGKENWCMIAYHSISTIADAYRKGLRGFDADFALKAMNDTMNHGHDGRDRELAEYRTATSPATAPTAAAATAPACKNSASLGRWSIATTTLASHASRTPSASRS